MTEKTLTIEEKLAALEERAAQREKGEKAQAVLRRLEELELDEKIIPLFEAAEAKYGVGRVGVARVEKAFAIFKAPADTSFKKYTEAPNQQNAQVIEAFTKPALVFPETWAEFEKTAESYPAIRVVAASKCIELASGVQQSATGK